jgi:hypothetical protein
MLGQGVKVAAYLGGATLAGSLAYLQYINYKLGGIDIDREAMVKYYTDNAKHFKVSETEASNMYYWLILDISFMRVLTYGSYTSYCEKIAKRIIDHSLKNYDEKNIVKKIEEVSEKNNPSKERQLFNEILAIRRKNFENIEKYDFIVKEVRKQQKLMDTRTILGLAGEKQEKIDKIHSFICRCGEIYKNTEIMKYNEQVPALEQMFPGDYVHKILFI